MVEALVFISVEQAEIETERSYQKLMKLYQSKANWQTIDFLFLFVTSLNNAHHYEKALEHLERVKQIQREYRGEESEKYQEIVITENKIKASLQKVNFNIYLILINME